MPGATGRRPRQPQHHGARQVCAARRRRCKAGLFPAARPVTRRHADPRHLSQQLVITGGLLFHMIQHAAGEVKATGIVREGRRFPEPGRKAALGAALKRLVRLWTTMWLCAMGARPEREVWRHFRRSPGRHVKLGGLLVRVRPCSSVVRPCSRPCASLFVLVVLFVRVRSLGTFVHVVEFVRFIRSICPIPSCRPRLRPSWWLNVPGTPLTTAPQSRQAVLEPGGAHGMQYWRRWPGRWPGPADSWPPGSA